MAEVGLKSLPKWWIDRQRVLFKPRGGGGGGGSHISADWRRVTPHSDAAAVTTTATDTPTSTGPCTVAGPRPIAGTPTTVGAAITPSSLGSLCSISPSCLPMTPTATMPRIRGRGIIGRAIGLGNGNGVGNLGNGVTIFGNGVTSLGIGNGNSTSNDDDGRNVIGDGDGNGNGHGLGNRLTIHGRSTLPRRDNNYSTMFELNGVSISKPNSNSSTTTKSAVHTFRRAAGGVGGGGNGGVGGRGEMGQASLFDNLIDLSAE